MSTAADLLVLLAAADERGAFQRWIGTTILAAALLGFAVGAAISWRRSRKARQDRGSGTKPRP